MATREEEISTAGVPRIFEQRFPGVTLEEFRCIDRYSFFLIRFSGDEDKLVSLGLIDKAMVPKRPKRVSHGGGARESVKRRKGNCLCVSYWIGKDFPSDHPLACLSPKAWPFTCSVDDRRELGEAAIRDCLYTIKCSTEVVFWAAAEEKYGFRLRPADFSLMQQIFDDFTMRLEALARDAHVEAVNAPRLQLVVNR